MARLQGCMLAGGALAVVVVADHQPAQAVLLVVARHSGHRVILPAQLVLDAVDAIVLNVERADEHVVGDIVQVAAVLEPGARHADVVRGALALDLDQHRQVLHPKPPGLSAQENV